MKTKPIQLAALLLAGMAVVMFGAARQDSATVDETTFLSAGYTYWNGHRFMMVPEHPPLSQMLPAIPLLFMDLKLSPNAQALLDGRAGYPWTRPWAGPIRAWQELFPQGRDNWYFWALPESQLFGQMFVYDGTNNGDAMMLAGRVVQILLTFGVGLLIFFWVRWATGHDLAALAGLAAWVFNPNALAHGHLTTTDMGVTFGMTAATFAFARLLEKPSPRTAVICGVATGVALLMKFTAVILAPMFIVLALMQWQKLRASTTPAWKLTAITLLGAWSVVMIVYFPTRSATAGRAGAGAGRAGMVYDASTAADPARFLQGAWADARSLEGRARGLSDGRLVAQRLVALLRAYVAAEVAGAVHYSHAHELCRISALGQVRACRGEDAVDRGGHLPAVGHDQQGEHRRAPPVADDVPALRRHRLGGRTLLDSGG